jgi:hypothetical protein
VEGSCEHGNEPSGYIKYEGESVNRSQMEVKQL